MFLWTFVFNLLEWGTIELLSVNKWCDTSEKLFPHNRMSKFKKGLTAVGSLMCWQGFRGTAWTRGASTPRLSVTPGLEPWKRLERGHYAHGSSWHCAEVDVAGWDTLRQTRADGRWEKRVKRNMTITSWILMTERTTVPQAATLR